MKSKIIWIVVAMVVVGGLVWMNKAKGPATSGEVIKIGAVLSLSGDAAQDGENIMNGLELAKADLAAKGVAVDLIYQDDKTDPKNTVSAINLMATQDVEAMIGPTWSYLADAGLPTAERLGITAVMPANTSEYVGVKTPYAFFTSPKVGNIEPLLTEWLKKNNKKRVAIISNQGAWYDTVTNTVIKSVQNSGGQVVFEERIPFGSEVDTMPTIISKLKNVESDLVFTEIDDQLGIVVMLKKIQEQNIPAEIMSVTTSINRIIKEEKVDISKLSKLYIIAPESSKEFQDRYQAKFGELPGAYSDRAYDSLMLLVEAIQNKGEMSLNEYLSGKTDYKGFVGRYRFDANGDISEGDWLINTLK